jgi:hypothetical protein
MNSGTLTATYASIAGRRESSLGYIYTGYMQLAVSDGTNMVEAMRINSSGNVGIGTTSPGAKLSVSGALGVSTYAEAARFSNTSLNSGAKLTFYGVQGSQAFTTLYGSIGFNATYNQDANGQAAFIIETGNNGSVSESARVTYNGSLLVGTTTNNGRICATNNNADWNFNSNQTGADATKFHVRFCDNLTAVGNITSAGSATSYNTSSDYRLKENIAPMTGALATVAQLNPVTYKWKSNGFDGQGFIAHELAEVVPDCVTGEKDAIDADGKPIHQGVDTSFLVATLTKAIQEQQALIESLTTRLTALENK